MPWTAPEINRIDPRNIANERQSLDEWLDYHRATLLLKCRGLTAEQLIVRPVATSSLSLLGLVRHVTETDRIWFRYRFAGQDIGPLYQRPDIGDEAAYEVTPDDAEPAFAAYIAEHEEIRAAVAGHDLDETFVYGKARTQRNLRWVYVHMIEEYARHNGHADLIRELVDGTVGL